MACGIARLGAQESAPRGVRVSVGSGVETADAAAGRAGASLASTRIAAEASQQRRSPRGSLRAWSGVTADQWWQTGVRRSIAAAANVDGGVTLTRRMRLDFAERVSSAPLDLFAPRGAGVIAGAPPTVLSGSEIPATRTLSHNGLISLARTIGPRSQVVVSGTQAIAMTGRDRVATSGATGRFERQVGRFTRWHAGYGFVLSSEQRVEHAAERRQNADVAFDYTRPLPFWGHTTLAASAGGSLLTEAAGRRVRMNAGASLDHRLNGRWSVNVDYARPVEYLAGVVQPLVTDSVRVGAAGLLPRQISFAIAAGASSGSVGVVGGSRFASYVGTAHASRRLGPDWQLDIEVHDSWYRFDASPGAGIPAAFARRGFRAGLVWIPRMRG